MKRPVGRPHKYPFPEMRVGDSFFIPGASNNPNTIGGCITYWGNKLNHVYVTKTTRIRGVSGLRVERVG